MGTVRTIPTEPPAGDTHELACGNFGYNMATRNAMPIEASRVDAAQAQACQDRVFDEARFREYIGDDHELVLKIVRCFLADTPGRLRAIHDGMIADDAPKVARGAHSLKGSIGFFAAGPAVEAAREMERLATTGILEGLAGPLAALEHELVRLTAALEAFLAYTLLSRPSRD